MVIEPALRFAIGVSITAHIAACLAWTRPAPPPAQHATKAPQIEIEYVKIPDPPPSPRAAPHAARQTPPMAMPERVEAQRAPDPGRPDAISPEGARSDAKREEAIRGTQEYINYYQLIREKIRGRLASHYRRQYGEGEAELVFVLAADGRLISADTGPSPNAGSGKTLRDVAVRSVRDAAPFPPFPKALALPRMSFTLQVSFRHD